MIDEDFFLMFSLIPRKNKSGAKGKKDSLYCVQNVFELEEFCPKNVSTYCTWLSNNAIDILRRKCISCAKLFTYGIILH